MSFVRFRVNYNGPVASTVLLAPVSPQVGLDELGGTEDFSTEVLEARLGADGLVNEDSTARAPKEAAAKSSVRRGGGASWR